jgi:poly-gamma-glutamate synthesis protein (capsule biosynthesis protein)
MTAASISEWLGVWTYPRAAEGDLEKMRFLDKVYWIHKTTRPVERARRGSGIETYFAAPYRQQCQLPAQFQVESRLTLSAVGDLMNHAFLKDSTGYVYEEIADLIFGADLSMANLECPVVPGQTKPLVVAFDTAAKLVFSEEEFDIVAGTAERQYSFISTACNHSLDFGVDGIASTVRTLNSRGITHYGVNLDADTAERAATLRRHGLTFGFISYTFGLNAHRPPADRPWMVNRMALNDGVDSNDFRQIAKQIEWCHTSGVDFIIGQLHWGLEHEFFPTPEQIELAHHLAELGLDLIVGHHPHVPQPFEIYQTRRDDGRAVPIYYSLGNLVNPFSADFLCRSGVARIELVHGVDRSGHRRTCVRQADLLPVKQRADTSARLVALHRDHP